jgi:glycosyltransferase involved in cell wall biosynthesis
MRIAVVASPVTPLQPAQLGGAQSLLTDLAVGLAERGHDVRLYCADGSDVAGVELVTVPVPEDAAAALVIPGGRGARPAPGVDAAITAIFDAIALDRPDVVSQHAFDAEAFRPRRGISVLHTLHLPPMVPDVVRAVRAIASSRLATVSHACLAMWREAGVEVGAVLPNGVADLREPDVEPDRVALIAGRLSREKGVDLALGAVRGAGLRARIAGPRFDPAYELDTGGAEIAGHLSRQELRRLMSRSAVTVCAPRWDEPFGLVAAEAQMAGCPVAAFARGGLPEVIEDGVSGVLAPPEDVGALATAIERCLELDRQGVRASARRRLGLDAAIDRYEAALQTVAAGS